MLRTAFLAPCYIVLTIMSARVRAAEARPIALVMDGASDYVVVLCRDASASEKWAAADFVTHVKQMTGATLKVRPEGGALPAKAVIIGDGAAARSLGVKIDPKQSGDDGFVIKTVGKRLVIAGGRRRGTMYGVYTVLESLGCRWWYPGESSIPKTKTLRIGPLDDAQAPVMEYRDMLYGENNSSEPAMLWRARNKLNGGFYKRMDAKYGGTWTFDTLVHSYGRLMPAGKYFKDHPEYFALVRGKRSTHQPCFSHPETVKIMADSIKRELKAHPEWKHITLGQNDNNNYCRCEKCAALMKKHGGSGAQLDFARRVAKIVHEDYPGVVINVPAYRWTRQPPKGIAPEKKSVTTLCSIECNFGQPLADGYPKENAAFKADIQAWSRVSPKLYIWDYTTNFTHYILPYPNYYVLQPNVKFFADHKVRGYMAQGSHTTRHGQFAPLCMWVLAKALWNPNADGRKLVEEFCLGYYGPKAGALVLEYANLLDQAIQKPRMPIWCTRRTYLSAPYLTPELMTKADQLFRRAEQAVNGDPVLLKRVQTDHVPVLYVLIKRPADMTFTADRPLPNVLREFAAFGRAARINRAAEGDHAAELFDWAQDYARRIEADPKSTLPAEVRKLPPKKVRFLQAAQLDRQVKFLQKAPGAGDGWVQRVISPGWSIVHKLGHPWDFKVGSKYRLFIRVKAAMAKPNDDTAITVGIHNPGRRRTCSRSIKANEVNGQWQVFDIGPWQPDKNGGAFYIARGRTNVKLVLLDCLWLAEQ